MLYKDQNIVLDAISESINGVWSRPPRVMVQAPCGFGKTVLAAAIAKEEPSIWFMCHRDFLMEQTSKTFNSFGISHSCIASRTKIDPESNTRICMIGSTRKHIGEVKAPKIAIWDEAHHIPSKTWLSLMGAMPDTAHIGLSATPFRPDKIPLRDYFDTMIEGPSVSYLIREGRLSDYAYFAHAGPDLTSARVRAGDYIVGDIDKEMSRPKIVGDIVEQYKKHAFGKMAIYFAPSIKTSKSYSDAFNNAGIPSVHLDADSTRDERRSAAVGLARGEIKVICNVGLLGEGFDLSAHAGVPVTVEAVGLCRPTKSLPLLIQQMMRCMRAKKNPGIILDHAGGYKEHGFLPDDSISWSIEGAKRPKTTETFQCFGCGATIKRGERMCQLCGYDNTEVINEIKRVREAEHVLGELKRVEREKKIEADKKERKSLRTIDDLIAYGKRKGMRYPHLWAKKVYQARMMK